MLVAGDRHVHLLYQVQQFAQYLQHIHLARSDPGLGRLWSFTNDCNWPFSVGRDRLKTAKSGLMIRTGDLQPGELSLAGAAVYHQRGLMLPAARFRKER